jgi:GTPase SAR1 family protein
MVVGQRETGKTSFIETFIRYVKLTNKIVMIEIYLQKEDEGTTL